MDELQAAHIGHHDIRNDKIGRDVFNRGKRISYVFARCNLVLLFVREHGLNKIEEYCVVIHMEDSKGHGGTQS